MNAFVEKLREMHWPVVLLIGVLMVLFLGLTDYLTGPELSFSIFYLIPISFGTLLSGRRIGFTLSLIGAAAWFLADMASGHRYSHYLIPYWNAVVRLGYFGVHTFLLSVLVRLFDEEKMKSLIDPLTNAANWRYFEEFGRRELQRSRRARKAITLAYFDLDNFKAINDSLGHAAGDDLLKTVSEVIQSTLRPSDLLARVGGDEFAILFPETDFDGAEIVLSRIHDSILSEMRNNRWGVTVSIGAVTYTAVPSSLESMLRQADALMYAVKKSGKNGQRHEQWPHAGLMNAGGVSAGGDSYGGIPNGRNVSGG